MVYNGAKKAKTNSLTNYHLITIIHVVLMEVVVRNLEHSPMAPNSVLFRKVSSMKHQLSASLEMV